nr:tetratricopeptide repeat protein [Lachnospiraceae bacterium]
VYAYYLGNYDEARGIFEKERGKNDNAQVTAYLGKTYSKLGDDSYAATLMEEYLKKTPEDAEICNELGLIKLRQSDLEGALAAFQKGIQINDEEYIQSLKYNEIVTYEYMRDFEKAKERMAEYVRYYPADEKAVRENKFLSTR